MAEYKVKAVNYLSFEVTEDGQVLGKLSYRNWLKFNAVIEFNGAGIYRVEPKGFWGTTIEVKNGEQVLLKFNMNWNGDIVIRSYFSEPGSDYLFRHQGVFKESFVLTDHEGTEQLVMKPQVKWRTVNYEFQITTAEVFETVANKEILLMNSLICANYYLSMSAGTGI